MFLLAEIRLNLLSDRLSFHQYMCLLSPRPLFPTSSRLLCFCRLALMVDIPASLCEVGVCSSAGRGIAEAAGLFVKFGTLPLV